MWLFHVRWAKSHGNLCWYTAGTVFAYPRPECQLHLAWVIKINSIYGNPSVCRITNIGPAHFTTRWKERGTETISPLRDDVAAACEDGRLFGTFFSALSVYHCWQRPSYRTRLFWAHCAMWRKLKTRGMILIDKNEWLVIFPWFTQEQAPHGNNSIDCKVYFLQNVVPDPLRPALLRIDVQDGTRAALMFHAQKW